MRVLVTGASGQLGSEVVSYLASLGNDIVPMTRADANLRDTGSVHRFILDHSPTHIIHCAAMTDVDGCELNKRLAFDINGLGSAVIAATARQIGAHVTYVSTDYVFDGTKGEPYTEDDNPSPLSAYGMSKRRGEQAMSDTDCIVRISWVFGHVGKNIVKTVLNANPPSGRLLFVDDQIGNPTYAPDAARAIVALSMANAGGVWHVTNGGPTSWYQFVSDVLRIAGIDHITVEPIKTGELQPPRPAPRPCNSVLSDTRGSRPFDALPHYTNALERSIPLLQGL